jgi:hypothetical protein
VSIYASTDPEVVEHQEREARAQRLPGNLASLREVWRTGFTVSRSAANISRTMFPNLTALLESRGVVARATAPVDRSEAVNHPAHYTYGGIETIDVIEAWDLDFHIGNAIKYLSRWERKGGVQDLEKAIWYIRRRIELEREKGDPA